MVRKYTCIALAGAVMLASAPAVAQDFTLPVVGDVDLDPLHIFTPAPPPPAPMKKKHHMKKKMMIKKKT